MFPSRLSSIRELVRWNVFNRKVISELREYPTTVYAAREYAEASRQFGEPIDLCSQVEYECAKTAKAALALARATRRRHGAAIWKPGVRDSAMDRELSDFIACERRRAAPRRARSPVNSRTSSEAGVARFGIAVIAARPDLLASLPTG